MQLGGAVEKGSEVDDGGDKHTEVETVKARDEISGESKLAGDDVRDKHDEAESVKAGDGGKERPRRSGLFMKKGDYICDMKVYGK